MPKGSTSPHRFNADEPLGLLQKPAYLWLNWLNNRLPSWRVDPELVIKDFMPSDLGTRWKALPKTSSPSRKLSDLFWMCLPWERIQEELGEINVLDTGCGSGNYGPRLLEWSGQRLARYVGTDVKESPNWAVLSKENPTFSFFVGGAETLSNRIPEDANLFMTQSALEHLEHDLFYFEQLKHHIMTLRRTALQVHMIPSRACLKLFRYHGIRQYTPRTVSSITRLFRECSHSTLFGLGGARCREVHYEFITRPLWRSGVDRREIETESYDEALLRAVEDDLRSKSSQPIWYALVIHSFLRNPLF